METISCAPALFCTEVKPLELLPLITIVKVVGAVLSIASSYKLVFLMQVHSFCADCCNKGYHTSSTEGGIQ